MYIWQSVGTGIKYVWKVINIAREITLNLLFLVILLLIFGIIELINNPHSVNTVPQSGVLVLDIEGVVVDSTPYDEDIYTLSKKLNGNKSDLSRENNLFELTQKIDQATSDPGIKGMILKLDNFSGADLPSLAYIAKYLTYFKESGKPIYAIGANFDQKQYYLASLANKIYLSNQGSVALYGFATNNFYFKSLLDHLNVNTHVFRVGTYKSAIEPFVRDNMSQAAKENTARWLIAMWNNYLTDISNYRNLSPDNLVPAPKVMLERLKAVSGNMGEYALENGIIDSISSYNQFDQKMDEIFHHSHQLSIYDYQLYPTRMQSFDQQSSTNTHPLIAVVFVNGTITTGNGSSNVAGSDSIIKQLRDIANNNNIHAVVLRINSPGGGVYASETIRSEIAALREKDIPVVVSMGGMAASGGYWIATQSDYIIASPNTITGSIGIFGMIPTFENSLSHLGVYTDGVSTSPLAGIGITKALPEEFNQLMQMNIENGYDNFVALVGESRTMSYEDVDQIAQGQVWLGEEAKEIGLVDELGDFDDAIEKAASLAKLTRYTIDWPTQETNFFNVLLNNYSIMLPKSAVEVIYNQLAMSKQIQQHIAFWDNLTDPQNRYAYCLNCADIK